ncbi:MAG TPA: DinB family protein [Phycisphaerales bacterium]|nr:DinB family protein [Phycisphaerales bacterium]
MPHPLISVFALQASAASEWAQGLSRQQLLATPVPGTWSMQTLLIHMLDSDLAATHRMRRIVAEETPLLIAYDETLFAQRCKYEQTDVAQACNLFAHNRKFTADWLATLDASAFSRVGVHNQRGKVTLDDMVKIYVDHVTHHEKFAMQKRRALGL